MATDQAGAVALIAELDGLKERLASGSDPTVRSEALQKARQLASSLQRPEDTAAELIFSVCTRNVHGYVFLGLV
jgi:hypothetical protein